jgi:hypothetical protein
MAPKDSPQVISFDKKFEKQQTAQLSSAYELNVEGPGKHKKV